MLYREDIEQELERILKKLREVQAKFGVRVDRTDTEIQYVAEDTGKVMRRTPLKRFLRNLQLG